MYIEKEDLINCIKENFVGLIDFDHDKDFYNFEIEAAIYYFACHFNSGQFSDLHKILLQSEYKPGRMETFERIEKNPDEYLKLLDFYNCLVDNYKDKI